MRVNWAVKLFLLFLFFPGSASAQRFSGMPALEELLRRDVSARWSVPASMLALEWGDARGALDPTSSYRLAGQGADGHFILLFPPSEFERVRSVRVRVGVQDTVAVAVRSLARGAVIQPGDIRWETRVHWGPLPDSHTRPEAGWVLRRSVPAGAILTPTSAEPPPLVRSGDSVEVAYVRGSVSVTLKGIAVHNATLGAPVLVRLTDSRKHVRGIVSESGLVLATR